MWDAKVLFTLQKIVDLLKVKILTYVVMFLRPLLHDNRRHIKIKQFA